LQATAALVIREKPSFADPCGWLDDETQKTRFLPFIFLNLLSIGFEIVLITLSHIMPLGCNGKILDSTPQPLEMKMKKYCLSLVLALLVLITLLGFFAQAQKRNNKEATNADGITLTDLGVTDAQKAKLKALWELKRQKHRQSIKDLRTLNRLAKDSVASTTEIRETLDKFRRARRKQAQDIEVAEDALIKTLPPRAQLHLTILGILDNGLTSRRDLASSQRGKKEVESQNRDDAQAEDQKK
jgi:Spy/CpxP family protein refolding chaperone